MSKRFVGLVVLVFVLAMAQVGLGAWDPNTDPSLAGWWKFDEGSGGSAKDSSGKGNDGTLNGGATWVPGWRGTALNFDGSSGYVGTGKSLLNNAADFTMAGWIKSVNANASRIGLFGQNDLVEMGFMSGNAEIWTAAAGTVTTPWPYNNDSEWHHFAAVDSGTSLTLYIDGVAATTGAGGTHATSTFFFNMGGGGIWDATGNWFNGQLDDIRLYLRGLTAQEVKSLIPPRLKAIKPDPANGAVGVLSPYIRWTPGETPVVFDAVYLGTSPDFTNAKPVSTQSVTKKMYLLPATAEPGNTYYWRIDSLDNKKKVVVTGDVWSFTLAPIKAWAPVPPDGAKYQSGNVDLAWTGGATAFTHDLFFSKNKDDVANGVASASQGALFDARLELPELEPGTTYYWRVDEIDSVDTREVGDVWSFTTRPPITKVANLVGWWKLEDESSGTVVDYSGWDHDGVLHGNPQWVDGYYGQGLQLDGVDDYVEIPAVGVSGVAARTITGWAKANTTNIASWTDVFGFSGPAGNGGHFDIERRDYSSYALHVYGWERDLIPVDLEWHHFAATFDGTTSVRYADGAAVGAEALGTVTLATGETFRMGKRVDTGGFFPGIVDDVRLYDKALTADEIKETMRGDPTMAWDPHPTSGLALNISEAGTLSWSAGEGAAQHDVYFGKDKAAVKTADAGSPEHLARQGSTDFSVAGLVEFGGGAYFWRIDEVEADGTTIHKGNVWTFSIPDYILVDDFESYRNDSPKRIFQTWIDGWGFSEDEFFPAANPGNGTSSTVGHDIWTTGTTYRTIVETTIVNTGSRQSMPFDYNNINSPYYSETDRTWSAAQNWTLGGMDTLSLWFRGYPIGYADDGSKVTMSASGADIWANADAFRFVYKRLNGDGSITAKVLSIANTDPWAKAGVMIRESLAPGSVNAALVVSAASGVSFQWRAFIDDVSANVGQTGLVAPYWIRLTRTGSAFKAEASADGKTWSSIGTDVAASSHDVSMGGTVYIGLCVTSHNANAVTVGEFSDLKTSGGVSGAWEMAEIGGSHPDNASAPLYVAVQDSAGKIAVVNHDDANAVLKTTWTEWQIPLSKFTTVNTKSIKKMYIGVGDRKAPKAGGAGSLFFDDIRVIKPAPAGQ